MGNCVNQVPDFPAEAFDQDCPVYAFGEVERVIVVKPSKDRPDDFTTEKNVIPGIGTIDEPEQPEVVTSLYRRAYPPARYELTFNVDDLSEDAYNTLRELHGARGRMWFQAGGYLYGGEDGIECDVKAALTIEEGEEALQKVPLHFTWRQRDGKMPEREESPWAEDES